MKVKGIISALAAAALAVGGGLVGAATANAAPTQGNTITITADSAEQMKGRNFSAILLAKYKTANDNGVTIETLSGRVSTAVEEAAKPLGYTDQSTDGDPMAWAGTLNATQLQQFAATLAENDEILQHAVTGNAKADVNKAVFTTSTPGIYLLIDRSTTGTDPEWGKSKPIIAGTAWLKVDGTPVVPGAEGTVELKNTQIQPAKVTKTADRSDVAKGDYATFTVTSTIPDYTGQDWTEYQYKLQDVNEGTGWVSDKDTSKYEAFITTAAGQRINLIVGANNGYGPDIKYDYAVMNGGFTMNFAPVILSETDNLDNDSLIGATITVKYRAQVTKSTTVGNENNGMKNTVTVTYGDTAKTASDSDRVFNFDYTLNKIDADHPNKYLAGATFTVQKVQDLTGYNGFTPQFAPISNPAAAKEYTTDEDGTIDFAGQGAGIYRFVETKAPEGYLNSKLSFDLMVYGSYTKDAKTGKITKAIRMTKLVDSEDTDDQGLVEAGGSIVTVKNVTSVTQLPKTGGMGLAALIALLAVCGVVLGTKAVRKANRAESAI